MAAYYGTAGILLTDPTCRRLPEAHQLTFWTIPVVSRRNTADGR